MLSENLRFNREALRESMHDMRQLPFWKDILRAYPHRFNYETRDSGWSDLASAIDKSGHALFYEFLNKEHIDRLSIYLESATERLKVTDRPITVLEIGAGNGRLAHFLKERIHKEKVHYIATDIGAWGFEDIFPADPVEKMGHERALNEYNPDIVIASWMIYQEDWTKDFRKTKSVKEYLLIGDVEACGRDWETWGRQMHHSGNVKSLYEQDGFEKIELEELSKLQLSRNDFSPRQNHNSKTVSFRRK